MSSSKIKVTLKRSLIRRPGKHRLTIQALGLRKVNATAIHQDNVAIRGMLKQVSHMVEIEMIEG